MLVHFTAISGSFWIVILRLCLYQELNSVLRYKLSNFVIMRFFVIKLARLLLRLPRAARLPRHTQQPGFVPVLWSSALATLSHTDLLCQKGTMHSSCPDSIAALRLNIELTCSSVKKFLGETHCSQMQEELCWTSMGGWSWGFILSCTSYKARLSPGDIAGINVSIPWEW